MRESTVKNVVRKLFATTGVAALFGALAVIAAPAAGAAPATVCTDALAPGTYNSVVVPAGATCLSDGPITIRGGLQIGAGATFVLGSEQSTATGTINGGVHATNPASVQIHFATINGGIDIQGGSGPFGGPFGITWNAIEDNTIHGGATVDGYTGFWFGFIRNTVSGTVSLTNNVLAGPRRERVRHERDPRKPELLGQQPAAQIGDSEGSPNVVTGQQTGECAAL